MVCGARALLPTSNVERRGKRISLPRGRTDFKSIGSRRRFTDPALAHRGAGVLGKVLSRTVRKFLNEQELLFPAPLMKLNGRERDILTRRRRESVKGDRCYGWRRHVRGIHSQQDGRIEPQPSHRQSDHEQAHRCGR